MRLWPVLLPLAIACGQAPDFRAERVVPSGGARQVPLAPGMLVSIYGEHLGPATQCIANADAHRTEDPNAARPVQSFAERLIFPTELCGVQVLLAGIPAGILYVSEKQINFKAPQTAPLSGDAELQVVYGSQSGAARVRVGMESTILTFEGEPRVGGPLWIHVNAPFGWDNVVQYPVQARPGDFGCNELEVRRNGVPLPRIALRPPPGGIAGGLICGNISVEGGPLHTGRLPLHLQYKLTEPGIYEVRYTRHGFDDPRSPAKILLRSEWTTVRLLPALPQPRSTAPAPTNPAELLSDYLPTLLALPDAVALDAVVAALYHPSYPVRLYASMALAYWPQAEADARVDRELAARGPSEVTVDATLARHPEMLPLVLPYLKSRDPVLLRAAVTGVSRWLYMHPADAPAESALLNAVEHVVRTADPQTLTNYAATLGTIRDPRAGTLLWDLIAHGVAREQALIATCWRKDTRDLPRLAALLEAPSRGDSLSRELASLPYAMRNSYGGRALPYLESARTKSPHAVVRTNCTRELTFAADEIVLVFLRTR